MRTITETYNVYNFSELSENAKKKVKQWFLEDDFRSCEFTNIYEDDLKYLFPNSELHLQYSLSYSQGDGLNIYGKLNLNDIFTAIRNKEYCGEQFKRFWNALTQKEERTIEAYIEVCGAEIELPYNRHYCYCVADNTEFAEEWIDTLEYNEYREIKTDTIIKLERLVIDIFTYLSKEYERIGYKFFYDIDEEELEEACAANSWEFLEDGTFYAA